MSPQNLAENNGLTGESESGSACSRTFKAGQFWSSNVCGAALGGAGAGVLMTVIMGIAVCLNPTPKNFSIAATVILILALCALFLFPGNLIATYPYAVSIEAGKGLTLYAPFKRLFIPIDEVQDVSESVLQSGYVVHLRRSHRLLSSFIIHNFFGDQARALVSAIRQEID